MKYLAIFPWVEQQLQTNDVEIQRSLYVRAWIIPILELTGNNYSTAGYACIYENVDESFSWQAIGYFSDERYLGDWGCGMTFDAAEEEIKNYFSEKQILKSSRKVLTLA